VYMPSNLSCNAITFDWIFAIKWRLLLRPSCRDDSRIERLTAATRTLKNSSMLLENIPKKRTRSTKGTLGSQASCNTRSLKDNQESSLSIESLSVFGDTAQLL